MIFKILGGAVAVAASVLAAGAVASAEKRRASQLYSFARLIEHLGRQIDSFNTPVGEIMKGIDPSLLRGCGSNGEFLGGFDSFLKSCDLALTEEEKRTLFSFSSELGHKFKDEQVKSCALYAAKFSELANDAAILLPKKRKVTYTMFICAALALIIILI